MLSVVDYLSCFSRFLFARISSQRAIISGKPSLKAASENRWWGSPELSFRNFDSIFTLCAFPLANDFCRFESLFALPL